MNGLRFMQQQRAFAAGPLSAQAEASGYWLVLVWLSMA